MRLALAKGVADGVKQAGWTDRDVLVCPPATLVLAVADAVREAASAAGEGTAARRQDHHELERRGHVGSKQFTMPVDQVLEECGHALRVLDPATYGKPRIAAASFISGYLPK